MISTLTTILWFLVALGILVTFHEFGHFYVARRCGVKVLRFSVGFGRPLYTWCDKYGTEFVLAAIPLGGYVKMLDEREGDVAEYELSSAFTQKTVWQRMAIVSAGPIFNFILAIVFYTVLALMGIKGLAPVIGVVAPNSLAAQAGLQANDEIVAVDGVKTTTWDAVFDQLMGRIGDTGTLVLSVKPFEMASTSGLLSEKTIPLQQWLGDNDRPDLLADLGIDFYQPDTDWVVKQIVPSGAAEAAGLQVGDRLESADEQVFSSWKTWVEYVRARPNQTIRLIVERQGALVDIDIIPNPVTENKQVVGKVGFGTALSWPDGMRREMHFSLLGSLSYGITKTWDQARTILSFLKKLITLDVSVKNMGGTFTIAQVAGDTAALGLTYYIGFLAFFSVSLGVFNLLPIPVLDGGHLLFYVIEAIKGKPLPEKVQLIGYQIGMAIVLSVMLVAHYNDLVRLFS